MLLFVVVGVGWFGLVGGVCCLFVWVFLFICFVLFVWVGFIGGILFACLVIVGVFLAVFLRKKGLFDCVHSRLCVLDWEKTLRENKACSLNFARKN